MYIQEAVSALGKAARSHSAFKQSFLLSRATHTRGGCMDREPCLGQSLDPLLKLRDPAVMKINIKIALKKYAVDDVNNNY